MFRKPKTWRPIYFLKKQGLGGVLETSCSENVRKIGRKISVKKQKFNEVTGYWPSLPLKLHFGTDDFLKMFRKISE